MFFWNFRNSINFFNSHFSFLFLSFTYKKNRYRPLKASSDGIEDSHPSSAAKLNNKKSTKTVTHGQSKNNFHHLIHTAAEAAQKNNRHNLSDNFNRKSVSNMQNQQPVTQIAPKIAKEISLRPVSAENGNEHEIRHLRSPPRVMIPERDICTRLPASPPCLTQATPSDATIVHPNYKPIPHRAVLGPARGVTVLSTPVKAQPALISSSLAGKVFVPTATNGNNVSKIDVTANGVDVVDNKPKHFHAQNPANLPAPQPTKPPNISHHGPVMNHHQYHAQQPQAGFQQHEQHFQAQQLQQSVKPKTPMKINVTARAHQHNGNLEFQNFHKSQECAHSSSDENRSSGHASMSDTGGHGSSSPGSNKTPQLGANAQDDVRLAAGVTSRNARSRASTGKPRHRAVPLKNPWSGSGLEDIKTAIQQMTLRSQTSTSTYSSLSAGSESSEPARRLGRYSSLETGKKIFFF